MRSAIVSLVAVAGLSVAAHGQCVMKMLVSTDGINFSSSVAALPGQHVDVLVTLSWTADTAGVAGFGSAIFQPIVSNWQPGTTGDHLSAFLQGGNQVGGMVNPQANANVVGSPLNPYTTQTDHVGTAEGIVRNNGTPFVPAGPYGAGSYGRVLPFGRTALNTASSAITGFVHTNPPADPEGRSYSPGTYLRISQANTPNWFNTADNVSGGSGVNVAQLYLNGRARDTGTTGTSVDGRHTIDPDFWGTRSPLWKGSGGQLSPARNSWPSSDTGTNVSGSLNYNRANGHTDRLSDIQVFRFGIDLSADTSLRDMLVDAPLAGQQAGANGRYMGWFFSAGSAEPDVQVPFDPDPTLGSSIQSATISVVPTPGALALLGIAGIMVGRRRRA